MDSSSSIRPEASTVHRAASTGEGLPAKNPGKNAADSERANNAESRDEGLRDLEGADTVIRQDFFEGLSGGSSRRIDERQQDMLRGGSPEESPSHGSSRSRAGVASDGSGNRRDDNPIHATPASLTRELQGQRLNHFELLEQIGGGGMGAVFRARDERLGRIVAVKVVPFAAGDPDLQRRFRNEAQSAAKLDHPLIARVFEVGNDGPWYYIVFEYIDGANIRDMVSQDGPLSLDDAVYYTCQVAEAIGHASKRGIVHRDIKPSNVVITETSSIKLVDMGLARSESFDTSEDMTASGVTLGTFDYISPEQAHDPRSADIRSDLYSLGCTFFYMLTSSPPFPGGTMLQKLLNHGNAAIPDVRAQRDDASEDLNAIFHKMLAKQPDQRYQDSQVLIADLRELALREDLPRSSGVDVVSIPEENRLLRSVLSHLPWVVATALLLLSAGSIEIFSWQQRDDFSSKLADTVPTSALDSIPVTPIDSGLLPREQGNDPSMIGPTIDFPGATRSGNDRFIDGIRNDNSSSLPNDAPATSGRSFVVGNETTPNAGPSDTNSAGIPNGVSAAATNSAPGTTLTDTASNSDIIDGGAISPGMASSALQGNPAMTSGEESTTPNKTASASLPSDPPSFQGFPFPINNSESDSKNGTTVDVGKMVLGSDLSDTSIAEMMLADAIDNSVALDGPVMDLPATTIPGDPIGSGLPMDALKPNRIRVVDQISLRNASVVEQSRSEGIALTGTLKQAIEIARLRDIERIDIDTPLLVCEPVVVQQDDLVIASSIPGGTAIVFRSTNEVDMQGSEMISIGANRIEFVDLHFYWTVPVTETDGGSLVSMTANRQVRLTDCSITIDNPSRRDQIFAFNVVTTVEPTEVLPRLSGDTGIASAESSNDILPLVSIELYNVIVRGEISMLRMDKAAELQLLWENGLLAVSGRMIQTGGSVQRPQPKSGSIRLSLQRLTAYTPRGLLQMQLSSSANYPVEIDRRADESVFVVDPGMPHVEITGTMLDDRDVDWLRIRGSSNAYETDATLSDPLLQIRDEFGQTNTTTMNDLLASDPPWADDQTPRWVVRWTDPLPESISPSQMIPADFRQDGSLFAGFQERSLPKMPMQRTFDIPPYE